jgi:hypothetical protein
VRLTSELRRGLPRTAAGRGGQQAEQHREGAVSARRQRPQAVLPARQPPHDVHGLAPHLRLGVGEEGRRQGRGAPAEAAAADLREGSGAVGGV